MIEEWRIAPGTFGCYEVSNLGRVRRQRDGLVLSVQRPRHSREYPAVMLRYLGERKRRAVHTLVALAFVGPPPFIGAQVRHLDGDNENPRADNLAWGSAKANADDRDQHGHDYNSENTYVSKSGKRSCKRCAIDRQRKRRAAVARG